MLIMVIKNIYKIALNASKKEQQNIFTKKKKKRTTE